jgi:hypothetical protein
MIDWASAGHTRMNGQVERANGMVLQGLGPRIFDQHNKIAGRWVQELLAVLWSLRTMSDPGLRDCVHNVVHTGLRDRTCPIPYLCCTLLACEVGLAGTEGNYSSMIPRLVSD